MDDDECQEIGGMLGKENLNQYRFVHHKSHIACTWIEPGPL
jgi:hypothetical protein